jgi:hypothetical protein
MCHERKVKTSGRCKTCRAERCIECGSKFQVFVRTTTVTKFRKKQWEHSVYEHRALVKTRTFERLCVNPDCPKHWDPAKLPPSWLPVIEKKVAPKKTLDEAFKEIELALHGTSD